MIQLTLKGTPFLFQGQEIGSINQDFTSIADMRDVESINLYQELIPSVGEEAAFKKVVSGGRDHARTPMQWKDTKNAGFTEGVPWIDTDEDYKEWNVVKQIAQENSVLSFYRKLIHLRKSQEALIYGDFEIMNRSRKNLFTYYRKLESKCFYVECNLSCKAIKRVNSIHGYELLLSNYIDRSVNLRPYESNLYQL
jgi:oligo-1,6-glucosidase